MKKIIIPVVILLCLAVIGLGTFKLMEVKLLSPAGFPANTTINGIDCSNLTMEQAQEKLTNTWNKKTIIVTSGEKQIDSFSNLDFSYALDHSLRSLQREHLLRTALNQLFGMPFKATIPMEVSDTGESLRKQVEASTALGPEDPIQTKNATIDLSTDDFEIIPEVYGNNLDYDAIVSDMAKAVVEDNMEFPFDRETYHEIPTVTADSPEIIIHQKACKEYFPDKMVYLFGSKEIPLTAVELQNLLDIEFPKKEGVSLKVSPKKKAIRKFVEKLAQKYNTRGATRKFTALSGNKITVTGGDYGYTLDVEKETKRLIKDLQSDEKIKRKPIWAAKGWGEYDGENDLGDTYVEVSLGAQHLWFYKNGKKVLDCPIVTGCITDGNGTPPGTFSLSYKQRGAVLRGFNNDGSKYESPVSYWMPFNGGIGLHDAPWRGAFGGGIYYANGSHGCVNMPPASAGALFNSIPGAGTPVVVHY